MIKDFSHDLTDTKQHIEQMVQQMMAGLGNIQLARLMTATVQYYCWRHCVSSLPLAVVR